MFTNKITLLLYSFNHYSQQSRSSLEKERDVNLVKIQEAETILKETEKSKNITVGKLNVKFNKNMKKRIFLLEDIILKTQFIIIFTDIICNYYTVNY